MFCDRSPLGSFLMDDGKISLGGDNGFSAFQGEMAIVHTPRNTYTSQQSTNAPTHHCTWGLFPDVLFLLGVGVPVCRADDSRRRAVHLLRETEKTHTRAIHHPTDETTYRNQNI